MATTILLARHGESDWNVAGRWQGHADRPLTERGREQAERLAERLAVARQEHRRHASRVEARWTSASATAFAS